MNYLSKKSKLKLMSNLLVGTTVIQLTPVLTNNVMVLHASENVIATNTGAFTKDQIKKMAKANNVAYYLLNSGEVYMTGYNNYGQLAIGNTANQTIPVKSLIDNVKDVVTDGNTTAFIKNDGSVFVSGYNNYGQLSIGSTVNQSIPMKVDITNAKQVVIKGNTLMILKEDGTVFGSGYNVQGALGQNTTTNSTSLVQIPVYDVKEIIESGTNTHLFLTNSGKLYGTGYNGTGLMGLGNTTNQKVPVELPVSNIKEVEIANNTLYILQNDGTLIGAGGNTSSQLGDGTATNKSKFVTIDTNVKSFSPGNNYLVYVKNDGSAFGTGLNTSGELGLGNLTTQKTPVKIDIDNVENVFATKINNTYFTKKDGTVYACGANPNNTLGTDYMGTKIPTLKQVKVNNVKNVHATNYGVYFETKEGDILITGSESYGLPIPISDIATLSPEYVSNNNISVPYPVFGSSNSFMQVEMATIEVNIAKKSLKSSDIENAKRLVNKITNNDSEKSRLLSIVNSLQPKEETQPLTLDYKNIKEFIFSGSYGLTQYRYALLNDGTLYASGNPYYLGVPGSSYRTNNNYEKVPVDNVKQVLSEKIDEGGTTQMYNVTYILTEDGSVYIAGKDIAQGGFTGTTINGVQRLNISDVEEISMSGLSCIFRKSDGTLWGTGSNSGQLGLGTNTTYQRNIVQLPIDNVKKILTDPNNTSLSSTYVVKNDGSIWVAGNNSYGQLGLGHTKTVNEFTQMPGINYNDVKDVKVYDKSSIYFLMKDGTIKACGYNGSKQMGLGDTTANVTTLTTLPIDDVKDFELNVLNSMSPGNRTLTVVKNDGTAYSCGYNTGFAGIGNATNQYNFMKVELDDIDRVFTTNLGTYFLKKDGTVYASGQSNHYRLGLENNAKALVPEKISKIDNVVDIYSSYGVVYMKKSDGRIYQFGSTAGIGLDYKNDNSGMIESYVNGTTQYAFTAPYPVFNSKTDENLEKATEAVVKAENTILREDYNLAKTLVDALENGNDKTNLLNRLQIVLDKITQNEKIQEAILLVEKAETTKTQTDLDIARTKVNELEDGELKSELIARLDAIQTEINNNKLLEATNAVIKAESTLTRVDYNSAKELVDALPDSDSKTNLLNRLQAVLDKIVNSEKLQEALDTVSKAEGSLSQDDVDTARDKVNALPDGSEKDDLISRLDKIQQEIDKEQQEAENQAKLEEATNAVVKAEGSLSQDDVDKAQEFINKLPNGDDKDNLQNRLDKVQEEIDKSGDDAENQNKVEEATNAVTKAETSLSKDDVNKAQDLINKLPNGTDKDNLQNRLDKVKEEIAKNEAENQAKLDEATKLVEKAENTLSQSDVDTARDKVNALPDSTEKDNLISRLDTVQAEINKAQQETENQAKLEEATNAVIKAETSLSKDDVNKAQDLINKLPNGTDKDNLQNRLDKVKEEIAKKEEAEKLEALIKDATEKVEKAETSKNKIDVSSAQSAINKLPNGAIKDNLQNRLDAVKQEIADKEEQDAYNKALDEAIKALEKAESTKNTLDVNTAQSAINKLPNGKDKTELQDRLDKLKAQIEAESQLKAQLTYAGQLVGQAERTLTSNALTTAKDYVLTLPEGKDKEDFLKRLQAVEDKIILKENDTKFTYATQLVEQAERRKTPSTINKARDYVNTLPDCTTKTDLLNRLNRIK